jgi:hypothetical protein
VQDDNGRMDGEVETRCNALETLGFRCSGWGYEADRWWKQLYLPNEITSLDTEDGLDNVHKNHSSVRCL